MPHKPISSNYEDFDRYLEEQKGLGRDAQDVVEEKRWTSNQEDYIIHKMKVPIVRTQKGVQIQYIAKTKTVAVRRKDGTFKSKAGYGKYIKQVQQIQLENKARKERLSGKERRKLKKLHRRNRT